MFIDRVKNGVECIEQIEKQPADYYSLILMNIQMPILDGYYTTQKIRRMNDPIRSHIPIIAMTDNAFAEDKKKALEFGMNDHIAKPSVILKHCVASALKQRLDKTTPLASPVVPPI